MSVVACKSHSRTRRYAIYRLYAPRACSFLVFAHVEYGDWVKRGVRFTFLAHCLWYFSMHSYGVLEWMFSFDKGSTGVEAVELGVCMSLKGTSYLISGSTGTSSGTGSGFVAGTDPVTLAPGDRLSCLLNMDEGVLKMGKNGAPLVKVRDSLYQW